MRSLLSALAMALVISACASPVAGKAVEAHFFDPCTELPEKALRSVGADPASILDDVQFTGWRMCAWRAAEGRYYLHVFTTEYRVEDFRTNDKYKDFRNVVVAGRAGTEYKDVGYDRANCSIGFDYTRGSVHIQMMSSERRDDACDLTAIKSRILMAYLPE